MTLSWLWVPAGQLLVPVSSRLAGYAVDNSRRKVQNVAVDSSADYDGGLQVIDASEPTNPVRVGLYEISPLPWMPLLTTNSPTMAIYFTNLVIGREKKF